MCAFCVCVCAVLFAFALTQRYQDSNRNRFDKKELLLCSEFCDFIIHFVIVCICECGKCQTRSHWVGFIGANRNRIIRLVVRSFACSFVRIAVVEFFAQMGLDILFYWIHNIRAASFSFQRCPLPYATAICVCICVFVCVFFYRFVVSITLCDSGFFFLGVLDISSAVVH